MAEILQAGHRNVACSIFSFKLVRIGFRLVPEVSTPWTELWPWVVGPDTGTRLTGTRLDPRPSRSSASTCRASPHWCRTHWGGGGCDRSGSANGARLGSTPSHAANAANAQPSTATAATTATDATDSPAIAATAYAATASATTISTKGSGHYTIACT